MQNQNNAPVDFGKLKTLREQTGVSFSLCKKALEESGNDMEQAKKLLQKWGGAKLSEKAGRATTQGAIFAYVHHNKKVAALIELLCETDFVSGNADFQKMGNEFAMQLASLSAETAEELLSQEYIRDAKKKMSDLIKEAVLKFGENIKIGKMVRFEL